MKCNTDFVSSAAKRPIAEENGVDHEWRDAPRMLEWENACVLPRSPRSPGGLVAGGRFVPDSAFGEDGPSPDSPPADFPDPPFEDAEVVYIGMMVPVWGHCLTDNLRHLWFLLDPRFASLSRLPLVFSSWNAAPLPDNFFTILARLGVDRARLREIRRPVRFAKVHFPTPCFVGRNSPGRHLRLFTPEYDRLLQKLAEGIPPRTDVDSVYFSRNGLQPYRDYGEALVERVFQKLGYAVFRPDLLSLEDQIALLKNCRRFAGTDGSVLHNSAFLPRGASLAIVRKADYFNSYQAALNQLRDLDVTYIDAHRSVMNPRKRPFEGPFFMYVSPHLARFAGISKPPFPLFLFLKYVLLSSLRVVVRKWLRIPREPGRTP